MADFREEIDTRAMAVASVDVVDEVKYVVWIVKGPHRVIICGDKVAPRKGPPTPTTDGWRWGDWPEGSSALRAPPDPDEWQSALEGDGVFSDRGAPGSPGDETTGDEEAARSGDDDSPPDMTPSGSPSNESVSGGEGGGSKRRKVLRRRPPTGAHHADACDDSDSEGAAADSDGAGDRLLEHTRLLARSKDFILFLLFF